eukprot:TRINITY_DN278_c0_g2_i1.p1 TRINITY_DN278_c0_g2~~TRINITY_DN278_c0_g2_i1.p1  ORF type:complete len:1156 (+),score=232.01 TRINITY_DN278_c0_g2_i1:36-3470(+)
MEGPVHLFRYNNLLVVRKYDVLEWLGKSRLRQLKYLDEKHEKAEPRPMFQKFLLHTAENVNLLKAADPKMPSRTSHAVIYTVELANEFMEKLLGQCNFSRRMVGPVVELRVEPEPSLSLPQGALGDRPVTLRPTPSKQRRVDSASPSHNPAIPVPAVELSQSQIPITPTSLEIEMFRPELLEAQYQDLETLLRGDTNQAETLNLAMCLQRLQATIAYWGQTMENQTSAPSKSPDATLSLPTSSLSGESSDRPDSMSSTSRQQMSPGASRMPSAGGAVRTPDTLSPMGVAVTALVEPLRVLGIRPDDYAYVPTDKFFVNLIGTGFDDSCQVFIQETLPPNSSSTFPAPVRGEAQCLSNEVMLLYLPASSDPKRLILQVVNQNSNQSSLPLDFHYVARYGDSDVLIPAFHFYDDFDFDSNPFGSHDFGDFGSGGSGAGGASGDSGSSHGFGSASGGWNLSPQDMLVYGAKKNSVAHITKALSRGANPSVGASGGEPTALHWAAWYGAYEAANALLSSNQGLAEARDKHGNSPLLLAAYGGQERVLKLLLDVRPRMVAVSNANGWTPLHAAIHMHSARCIFLLLESGAAVTSRDREGNTPLHIAMLVSAPPNIVSRLLSHGAQVANQNFSGRTPLHVAAQDGADVSLSLLLGSKEAIMIRDSKGLSPIQVAAINGQASVFVYLFLYAMGLSLESLRRLRLATASFTHIPRIESRVASAIDQIMQQSHSAKSLHEVVRGLTNSLSAMVVAANRTPASGSRQPTAPRVSPPTALRRPPAQFSLSAVMQQQQKAQEPAELQKLQQLQLLEQQQHPQQRSGDPHRYQHPQRAPTEQPRSGVGMLRDEHLQDQPRLAGKRPLETFTILEDLDFFKGKPAMKAEAAMSLPAHALDREVSQIQHDLPQRAVPTEPERVVIQLPIPGAKPSAPAQFYQQATAAAAAAATPQQSPQELVSAWREALRWLESDFRRLSTRSGRPNLIDARDLLESMQAVEQPILAAMLATMPQTLNFSDFLLVVCVWTAGMRTQSRPYSSLVQSESRVTVPIENMFVHFLRPFNSVLVGLPNVDSRTALAANSMRALQAPRAVLEIDTVVQFFLQELQIDLRVRDTAQAMRGALRRHEQADNQWILRSWLAALYEGLLYKGASPLLS